MSAGAGGVPGAAVTDAGAAAVAEAVAVAEAAVTPRVSVVVLAWRCGELLCRAVESAAGSRGVDVDVVVVDNGSPDAATQAALDAVARAGTARVLRLPDNLGFARGMNAGHALTTGDPVCYLNCDAVLAPDALARAAAVLAERPEVGVVAPHVHKLARTGRWRFWVEPDVVVGFDGGVVGLDARGKVTSVEDHDDAERLSFKPNGACPVVRRAVVEDLVATYGVGPFDPVFDTYGEDVDVAWKTWALGWTTLYRRDVEAGHVRSFASALEREDKRGRLRVNLVAERYLNAWRHRPLPEALSQVGAAVVDDLGMVAWQLRRGDLRVLTDVGRGWARVVRHAPALASYRSRHREWHRVPAAATSCPTTRELPAAR